MEQPPQHFPFTGIPAPADAAAVILWTEAGRYLVQDRDDIPGIYYPGHVGLFGGGREGDESFEACALRELMEETALDLAGRLTPFSTMTLGFEPFGLGRFERVTFAARITESEALAVQPTEGRRAELLDGATVLRRRHVVPYDAFALWQHVNRASEV